MPLVGKVGNAAKGKNVKWVSCPCARNMPKLAKGVKCAAIGAKSIRPVSEMCRKFALV